MVLATVKPAHLKWFSTTSSNFREYRVLNATLRFVGNVTSTTVGNFSVFSSRNEADVFSGAVPGYSTMPGGTSVASLATKDQRFRLNIDSSWKPVSYSTLGALTDQVTFYPLNSVDTLSFCSFAVSNNSGAALGIMYLDYDVEFRGPINPSLNA